MRGMRLTILLLTLIVLSNIGFGQKRSRLDVQRADKFFESFEYAEAAQLYKKIIGVDSSFSYAKLRLAESYRKMNQPENAARWYSEIVEDSIASPIHKLYYAQALMTMEQYDEARMWLVRYRDQSEDEQRADNLISGIDNYQSYFLESDRYRIDSVIFNSKGADFSPAYFRNGLVFTSNRDLFKLVKRKHGWDNTNFTQLYYTDHTSDSIDKTVPFSSLLNTKYHEGPLTFYDNYEKVIFTRNNYNRRRVGKSKDEVIHLQLYLSERSNIGEEWSKPKAFSFNNPEYNVGHPSISEDETVLFFASDMPGGYGGVDLYVTRYVNDQWIEPSNLGPQINTPGDEVFPYINDSILYFSSDGHPGMGGLDLYQVRIYNTSKVVKNLGSPMNSSKDDFGIVFHKSDTLGYFTSQRNGGRGSDDIYSFTILKPPKPKTISIKGIVVDQRSQTPLDSTEVIMSTPGQSAARIVTSTDGTFEFDLDWDKDYQFTAARPDWTTGLDSASTYNDILDKDSLVIPLRELLVISGNLTNPENGAPVENALLTFTETTTGKVDSVSTNEEGVLYFIAQPNSEYDVFLQKTGYFNFRTKVSTGPEPTGKISFDLDMEQIVIGRAIRIENIYFDLNKSDIRPDAAIELDKIVAMMTDNPTIQIELGSHTDSRGGDDYNLALSDRRARSSAAYIVSKGIAAERIVGKGFGETQLVNQCVNGVRCTNDEHQPNRRTEFKVISF